MKLITFIGGIDLAEKPVTPIKVINNILAIQLEFA
jgi:hypothetical protein